MKTQSIIIVMLTWTLFACQEKADTAETSVAPVEEKTATIEAPVAPVAPLEEKSATKDVAAASTQLPADHLGAGIHKKKCETCHKAQHDAAFYQRADRKMDSYKRLQSQIRMCDSKLNTELFDEDMEAIGEYLNTSFYKFPTE